MTGKEIRDRRIRLRLSQEQLAKLIGVSRVTIARWETDRQKPLPVLERILNEKLNVADCAPF
jgi:transcriptional regulator with XRE-family HTH domain